MLNYQQPDARGHFGVYGGTFVAVAALEKWVTLGAPWPVSAKVKTVTTDHWAFKPVKQPNVPT